MTAIGCYSIFPAAAAHRLAPRPERAAPSCARCAAAAAHARRADDRRLGLRRRRRHPGRPEGVRPLRRARHVRDHRRHRAEHGRGERRPRAARRSSCSPRSRAVLADIGVDAVKVGMLGDARDHRAPWPARSTSCRPGTPVVVDPVMVAESGARLLDADAQGALVEEILPRATRAHARTCPRRAALAGRARRRREELRRGAVLALGPERGRAHRRAPRARRRPVPGRRRRRARSWRSPACATPTARRTARAARTPRCSPRSSRSGDDVSAGGRASRARAGRRGDRARPARRRRGRRPGRRDRPGRGAARGGVRTGRVCHNPAR